MLLHYIQRTQALVFKALRKAHIIRLEHQDVIQRMVAQIRKPFLKNALGEISRFAILINFGTNENLCDKLLQIQYFKIWVRYSQ